MGVPMTRLGPTILVSPWSILTIDLRHINLLTDRTHFPKGSGEDDRKTQYICPSAIPRTKNLIDIFRDRQRKLGTIKPVRSSPYQELVQRLLRQFSWSQP